MDALQRLGEFGALGVISAVLLWWAWGSYQALARRLGVMEDWVRDTLLATIRDQGATMVEVRQALDRCPCGRFHDEAEWKTVDKSG